MTFPALVVVRQDGKKDFNSRIERARKVEWIEALGGSEFHFIPTRRLGVAHWSAA